jgi:hypothetical protein
MKTIFFFQTPPKMFALFGWAGVGLLICSPFAFGEKAAGSSKSRTALSIEVQDRNGQKLSGLEKNAGRRHADSALLTFQRTYEPGDRIVVTGTRRMAVRVDEQMPECLVSLGEAGRFVFEIPYDRTEKGTGSSYAPESFAGDSHRVTVRALNGQEGHEYRNLALNPCDRPQGDAAAPSTAASYPHASTNSVARGLHDFDARNAIDGVSRNGHHGVWPYQSWGPEQVADAWWKVEFGRPVTLDKIRLMIRGDFPHDSYWKSADVEFSDGSSMTIQIEPKAGFQEFTFPARRAAWVRLTRLVATDPHKWCSLVELEAWGRD